MKAEHVKLFNGFAGTHLYTLYILVFIQNFSITESIVRIPDLVKAAKAEGMPALAITETSNFTCCCKILW